MFTFSITLRIFSYISVADLVVVTMVIDKS